ncbi:Transcription initiation factor TFIID subunit 14b [Hibiscus syriacus]|uniref:Transcription initiation factor TFIID subunit 14b n=1 Tax=Hibiscus syriacus TaxID=106335 RepID=A0A6A2WVZ8_HIBSY|nr:Transcription initiation factor TFIID subunit 14b [Hibiscus syriacus]
MPHTATESQVVDGGSASKPQRIIKLGKTTDESDKKSTNRRVKDVELCVPIVYGTIAFYLGRKASDFNNPTRVVESPPFELSECGWGEFEIGIGLFFHSDVCDKKLDLFHFLKLYPEDESGPQSTKKPVVMESYNEIVFPEPSECFFARAQNHPAIQVPRLPAGFSLPAPAPVENMNDRGRGDTKDHPLSQWFMNFSEADELLKLASARQQVQAHIVKLRRELSVTDGMPQPLKPASSYECI